MLFKNSDFLVSSDENKYSEKALDVLEDVYANHPEIPIIDSFPSYKEILTRGQIIFQLQRAISTLPNDFPISIKCPKSICIEEGQNIQEEISKSELKYPFLHKPWIGTGKPIYHLITMVCKETAIKDLSTPCLCEEFINNDGILYKLYALGDDVYYYIIYYRYTCLLDHHYQIL